MQERKCDEVIINIMFKIKKCIDNSDFHVAFNSREGTKFIPSRK
jgi:hypothetical protein